jgi:hypothetical protein
MDRSLWITWYDLPEGERERHLDWLHQSYLPALNVRSGILYAVHYAAVPKTERRASAREGTITRTTDPAVPTGSQYVLLVGAEQAHVFGDPSPAELHASMSESDRRMLGQRSGVRVNIMVEAGRVDGPSASSLSILPAPCIQLGNFNIQPAHEEEVLAWYTRWRMPAMARTPGCARFRTLASVSGWAKHAVLYEFVSLAARNEHFVTHEDARPDMKALSDRMVSYLTHSPGSAMVAVRTWPP